MDRKELDRQELERFCDFDHHKRVVHFDDKDTGLQAFISVHNTNLGPALGGCRIFKYAAQDDAVRDVLRLSRGMTYKNALAGLPLGGGKSVIIADPAADKTPTMMEAMGRAVESLKGEYITAEDSGTTEEDMVSISKATSYVVGLPHENNNESEIGGNPSPYTSYGVYSGLKVAAQHRYGSSDLSAMTVAIQGVGAVGHGLCKLLQDEGAKLVVTDVNQKNLDRVSRDFTGVQVVAPDEIFAVNANIFSPCALGGQLNDQTIPQMTCDIIGGAANNQLATAESETMLADKDILYLPDYVLNAGGVISACYEYLLYAKQNPFSHDLTHDNMMAHIRRIGDTLQKIFIIAKEQSLMMGQASDRLAEDIFMHAGANVRDIASNG